MAIEIRNPGEDELRATFNAAYVAFGEQYHESEWEFEKEELPLDRVLGAYEDGRPVGVAASFAFEMTVPGGPLPTAGVTFVGVQPTHRRRGLLREFMRRQLDDVHARGEPLAALYASESVIYGRFGYGVAAPSTYSEADQHAFALRDDPGPSGNVRLVEHDEAVELFPPIYERVRPERNGFLSRIEPRWRHLLADLEHWREGAGPKYYAVLELDGAPAGYAMYRVASKWERGTPQGEVRIQEATAVSVDATRELWRYLFGIDLVTTVKTWQFDPGSPLVLMVRDPRRLHLRLGDGLWLRLVDVGEALCRRSYAGEGSVMFEVLDDFCPWNQGCYRAGEEAGPADGPAELRLSSADLASAYLGAYSFERLAAAGRVEELAPGALERASVLFRTPLPPFCPEGF